MPFSMARPLLNDGVLTFYDEAFIRRYRLFKSREKRLPAVAKESKSLTIELGFDMGGPTGLRAGHPSAVFADQAQVEAQIKAAFERYVVAWNNANPDGIISLYSEDARIAEGLTKNIITMANYRELLPGKFSRFGKVSFQGEPVVAMNDDGTSMVKVSAQYAGIATLARFVFLFKQVGDAWLIYDQDY